MSFWLERALREMTAKVVPAYSVKTQMKLIKGYTCMRHGRVHANVFCFFFLQIYNMKDNDIYNMPVENVTHILPPFAFDVIELNLGW